MRGSVMSVALAFLLLITACAPERPVILHQLDVDCGYPPCEMFGLEIKEEATIYAPFAGRVELVMLDRNSTDKTPALPEGKTYVQLQLYGWGEILALSLGIVSEDVVLLVRGGSQVAKGDALSKVVGFGPSYWTFTQDHDVRFQVVGDWTTWSGHPVQVDEKKAESFLRGRSR